MKGKTHSRLWQGLASLIGIAMAFSVEAGTPEGTGDPLSAALDWEDTLAGWSTSAHSVRERSARRHALLERAMARDTMPVIVLLKDGTVAQGPAPAEVQSRWTSKRQQALKALGLPLGRDRSGLPVKTFAQRGGFAMQADAIDILDLLADPNVLDVVEDVAYPPALLQSMPLIGASASADFAGYTGLGQVIAILDTGVDKSHPLLSGKVVSEACYSTNDRYHDIRSLCPGGAISSTAEGSGLPCPSGCSHGTHVAGIAAGHNTSYRGVAKDAKLIAIQVFSDFPPSECGTSQSRCVMAYTSDIIRGLERVYALRTSYSIAAANLSLGGGGYTSACDADAVKPSIDKLRAAGIATVIASGNGGYSNAISSPACISTAISVGATCDYRDSGYCAYGVDGVAYYSNSANFLTLLAPGSLISSAVPGGYGSWHGTSMATPHVAGAWAVLKQAKLGASVDEVLNALRVSGKLVTDPWNGVKTPRINPAAAVVTLLGSGTTNPTPPAVPAVYPASQVTTSAFTANWAGVPEAAGYRLDVSTSSSFTSFLSGYNNLNVGTSLSRVVSGLSAGRTYHFRVRAYNASGTSTHSGIQSVITVPAAPASASATNITSSGFTAPWSSVTGASGYRLDVATNSSFTSFVPGYQSLDVGTGGTGTTRTRAVSGLNPSTTYYYRVRAYNDGGSSASSTTRSVTTRAVIPAAPVLKTTAVARTSFTLGWDAVPGATGYRLDVSTRSDFATRISGYSNLSLGNVTSRTVSGSAVKPNTTYYVRLRATSSAGTSPNSATLVVKTLP